MNPQLTRIQKASRDLQAFLQSIYEGRSVRTPEEFKADLSALHAAIAILDALAADQSKEAPQCQTQT